MEKVKEILLTAGKTALNSAVELGRSPPGRYRRLLCGQKDLRPGQGESPAPAAGGRRRVRRAGHRLSDPVADRAEEISLHVQ